MHDSLAIKQGILVSGPDSLLSQAVVIDQTTQLCTVVLVTIRQQEISSHGRTLPVDGLHGLGEKGLFDSKRKTMVDGKKNKQEFHSTTRLVGCKYELGLVQVRCTITSCQRGRC